MIDTYILDGKTPVRCIETADWSDWMRNTRRRVARTIGEDAYVTTIFLGVNHSFFKRETPQLFETMVFQDNGILESSRYATWDEALQGHHETCERLNITEDPSR